MYQATRVPACSYQLGPPEVVQCKPGVTACAWIVFPSVFIGAQKAEHWMFDVNAAMGKPDVWTTRPPMATRLTRADATMHLWIWSEVSVDEIVVRRPGVPPNYACRRLERNTMTVSWQHARRALCMA